MNPGSRGTAERRPILRLLGRVLKVRMGCPDSPPPWEACEIQWRSPEHWPTSVLPPNYVAEQQVRVGQELRVFKGARSVRLLRELVLDHPIKSGDAWRHSEFACRCRAGDHLADGLVCPRGLIAIPQRISDRLIGGESVPVRSQRNAMSVTGRRNTSSVPPFRACGCNSGMWSVAACPSTEIRPSHPSALERTRPDRGHRTETSKAARREGPPGLLPNCGDSLC